MPKPPNTPTGWTIRDGTPTPHDCELPHPNTHTTGALWACRDRHLWRLGLACHYCNHYGEHTHPGTHTLGIAWWPASRWTCITHRMRRPHVLWGKRRYDTPRTTRYPHGTPPKSPSGVSLSPDGKRR
jgi:hypothetical protein